MENRFRRTARRRGSAVADVLDDVADRGLVTGSFLVFSSICWIAYTTVEWSRPPNSLPISTIGICVISRTMYIEIWRANEMFALRFEDLMSSGETPYVRATSSMILPTVTGVGWSLLTMSLIARCAVLIVGLRLERWIALSFLTVPRAGGCCS